MSAAYVSPPGSHRHTCHCGAIWEHTDACRGQTNPHVCPKCGFLPIGSSFHYEGPDAPNIPSRPLLTKDEDTIVALEYMLEHDL